MNKQTMMHHWKGRLGAQTRKTNKLEKQIERLQDEKEHLLNTLRDLNADLNKAISEKELVDKAFEDFKDLQDVTLSVERQRGADEALQKRNEKDAIWHKIMNERFTEIISQVVGVTTHPVVEKNKGGDQ